MDATKKKLNMRFRRAHRVRARLTGSADRPRLSVFRSNQHIYAQLIDDQTRKTLCAANSKTLMRDSASSRKGVAIATQVGEALAHMAVKKKITAAVFDRSSYRYHGLVKALAEGARKGGLQF